MVGVGGFEVGFEIVGEIFGLCNGICGVGWGSSVITRVFGFGVITVFWFWF